MADEKKDDDELTQELLKKYNIAAPAETGESTDSAAKEPTYNPFLDKTFDEDKPAHSWAEAVPGAVIGGALGYGVSGARLNPLSPSAKTITSSAVTPFVERKMGLPAGQIGSIYETMKPAPPSLTSAAQRVIEYPSSMPTPEQTQRILGGTIDETHGTSGRARTGGFNEETQRLARAQAEREQILDRLRQRGLISGADPLVSAGAMTKTASGISIPVTAAPQPAPVPTPAQTVAATMAKDADMAKAVQKAKTASRVAGGLSVAGKVATGAGAGFGALDAYNRYQAGDKLGAAISGLTAIAGIPFPIIATAIGVPVQWVHDNPGQARAMYEQAKTTLSNPMSYQYPSEAMQ